MVQEQYIPLPNYNGHHMVTMLCISQGVGASEALPFLCTYHRAGIHTYSETSK